VRYCSFCWTPANRISIIDNDRDDVEAGGVFERFKV